MLARALFPADFWAYANAAFAGLPELKPAERREAVLLVYPAEEAPEDMWATFSVNGPWRRR